MIHIKDLPAPDDRVPIRRALISVFDKVGLVELARSLHELGVELISTGGSAKAIADAGLPVRGVEELTGFPEILGGRVKTLHPAVHGGLLARRNDPDDLAQLAAHGIGTIDLVVVNLYPFAAATASADTPDAVAAENIDIGGPTMIRAAAKNFFFVSVVTDPADYAGLLDELRSNEGSVSLATRRRLSRTAFAHTASYDAAIASYFDRANPESSVPAVIDLRLGLSAGMRYGENPHQAAGLYGNSEAFYEQLHGKELSFNNLLDLSAALLLIDEFAAADPTVAILKHTNPCGVSTARTLRAAYDGAFATDRQSPFGGIVVVNQCLDLETARAIDGVFTEIVIAPDFDPLVLEFLAEKKNRRVIRLLRPAREDRQPDLRSVVGGLLLQARDAVLPGSTELRDHLRIVTRREPTEAEWRDLDFAWRIVKHVKSNAIVYAKGQRTLGIGAGQMSRIDSSEIAVTKGAKSGLDFTGSVVASDAFFPFADGLIEAANAGACAAIQPGGSVRDDEVIAAADERSMAMVFTGSRHFRH